MCYPPHHFIPGCVTCVAHANKCYVSSDSLIFRGLDNRVMDIMLLISVMIKININSKQ